MEGEPKLEKDKADLLGFIQGEVKDVEAARRWLWKFERREQEGDLEPAKQWLEDYINKSEERSRQREAEFDSLYEDVVEDGKQVVDEWFAKSILAEARRVLEVMERYLPEVTPLPPEPEKKKKKRARSRTSKTLTRRICSSYRPLDISASPCCGYLYLDESWRMEVIL